MQSAVLAIVNLSVRLSVRLSVTRSHCDKTTQATIMGSSLEDSPMTSFQHAWLHRKITREHVERGRRM